MPDVVYEHGEEDEAVVASEDAVIDDETRLNAAPSISKSWAVSSAHVPSYTGGKVVLCHGRGAKNLYGRKSSKVERGVGNDANQEMSDMSANENEVGEQGGQEERSPFLLAPCGGDLSLVDAAKGVMARTIRTGCSTTAAGTSDGSYLMADDDDDGSLSRDAVTAYTLAPNDMDLVVCSRDSILRQYDLSGSSGSFGGVNGEGPAKVRRTIGRSGHDLPVTHMEFHCSGIFFATGSVEGLVKVWDLRGGYATHSFRSSGGMGGRSSAVSSIAWHPDASQLIIAIGRDDGSIALHDLRSESAEVPLVAMSDHVSAVTCMVWVGKDRGLFITAGRDAIINTWSVEVENVSSRHGDEGSRRKQKRQKQVKNQGVEQRKASLGTNTVYRRIRTLPVYEQIEGLVVLPRYHHSYFDLGSQDIAIATAGSKGVVRVWRARHIKASSDELNKNISISDFEAIAEQGKGSAFGEKRGGYVGLIKTSHSNRLRVSISTSEKHIPEELIAVDAEHNMTFLNLEAGNGNRKKPQNEAENAMLQMNRTIVGHNDEILDIRVIPSPPGSEREGESSIQKIAVATNSAQVRIFELGTYSCEVLDGHTETVLSLDVSPCGRYLSTCGKDKSMRLWHIPSGRCIAVATGHTEAIGATALSRKIGRYDVGGKSATNGGGAFAVTASRDKTLKKWALPGARELNESIASDDEGGLNLRVLKSVRAHEKDINIVSVAPNDSFVATGSQDKTVKLWNSSDLSLHGCLKGHKRGVWDCQFSPFDRVLATCSGDRTVKLWSLADLGCVRTFQGHAASTLRVRFLSGGLQLLSSGADGLVKLWTIRTNECEATMDGHSDKVWALDLHQDGESLVTGGADSSIVVWRDTTKELEEAKKDEEEKTIIMEQRLANHLRFKEYEKALEIALELDKPRQALKVLTAIIENDVQKGENIMTTLERHVKGWPMSRTTQVLRYCRDWNTRARNSHIAMLTVKAILSAIPAQNLAATAGVPEILAGITPYAERHFQRLDRLHASSYLIDYALFSMGNLDDDVAAEAYSSWEANSKLVVPSTKVDGRIQVGGSMLVGSKSKKVGGDTASSDDEVMTVGDSDSDSCSDEESGAEAK